MRSRKEFAGSQDSNEGPTVEEEDNILKDIIIEEIDSFDLDEANVPEDVIIEEIDDSDLEMDNLVGDSQNLTSSPSMTLSHHAVSKANGGDSH
ncbi:hypothetical protein JCGZ_05151 [Jatropha curcas]|uniref:Uncharacterized protein n=1 Tax=Jatropha curcas TaxID=180498 RepID=A0A067L4P2_JATCU|nr:hypothetical protein JCGZ_05151 [Jatropha curcas]